MEGPRDECYRTGECVRYVGEPTEAGWGEGGSGFLLGTDTLGHVLLGPSERGGHPCYRVLFGGRSAWVRADLLRAEPAPARRAA
jgi:hypothetical protein